MKQTGWILTGAALAVLVAVTAGTQPSATPLPGDLPADIPRMAVSHEPAPGMVAVQMHDLQDSQLIGIRERIVLPDSDGLMRQMGASTPGSAIMPPTGRPAMQQTRRADINRGLQLGEEDGETPAGADGLSWGWLADDVGAAVPPSALTPESGGFGFTPSSGSRLYKDRDERLGTDQGFGTGGDDAFIFQRRDERF